jgi:hypothetical protein
LPYGESICEKFSSMGKISTFGAKIANTLHKNLR